MNTYKFQFHYYKFIAKCKQLPPTYFTSIANKSVWAAAVKAVSFIDTGSIVEARVTVAFIDVCNNRNHNKIINTFKF